MSINNPLVSIIITTYKRGVCLRSSILSVVNQTYKNIEIIIVDDDPLSKQMGLCDKIKDKYCINLKYIKNDSNVGGAESRNIGVRNSSGYYFGFLDDDDEYLENKIELLINEMSDGVDVVFGDVIRKSSKNSRIKKNTIIKSLFYLSKLHTNGSLVSKYCYQKAYFVPGLKKFQDTQFHAFLIKEYCCKYVPCSVAIWNDDHIGPQVTDMTNEEKIKSSIQSYDQLRSLLKEKNYLSLSYSIKMWLSYINMLRNFKVRFKYYSDLNVNPVDTYLSNFFAWVYRYDKFK